MGVHRGGDGVWGADGGGGQSLSGDKIPTKIVLLNLSQKESPCQGA